MDNKKTTITIRTHNLNGFESSCDHLRRECDDASFSIAALQEHWLRPSYKRQKGVNRLKQLHPDYDSYATSGMSNHIDQKVLKGRPFGGTGFLFKKNLSNCIRARVDLKNNRVTVLELNTLNEKIMLINAYMPYFSTNNNLDLLSEYRETLAFIENTMISSPHHNFILLMDMNCNIFGPRNCYSDLICEMMSKFDLISNFEFSPGFDPNNSYTRFDVKKDSYTLIDGILVSRSLSNIIESSHVLFPHDNVSDHLPVEITISVNICDFLREPSPISYYIPWISLCDEEKANFQECMLSALREITIPIDALNHCHSLCDNGECMIALETFYNKIISAIESADNCLPRKKHGLAKDFWSPELTNLKQKSFDANELWKSCGSPRSGPIFDEKVRSNLLYKSHLRKAKSDTDCRMSTNLSNDLLNKDCNNFWKTWKQVNGSHNPPSSMIDGFVKYDEIASGFSDT